MTFLSANTLTLSALRYGADARPEKGLSSHRGFYRCVLSAAASLNASPTW